MFTVSCTSDKLWNIVDLVGYLAANQGKSIALDVNPEAICLHNLGLYDLLDKFEFQNVIIYTHNPLETHHKYIIKKKDLTVWFKQVVEIDAELHRWDLSKVFLCFYYRPTAARLALASYVSAHHSDCSLVHFSAKDSFDFELDKLLQWDRQSAADAAKMLPELPLLLGSSQGYSVKNEGYYYTDPLTNLYRNILIDIVVESHVAGTTFFPTEKTMRPMWLKKPFIVFGSQDYLAYLRQMGFRTFGDFWDEDYDGYEKSDRLAKIKTLIQWLAAQPRSELEKMYWDMQYTLDHNYNLLVTQTYNKGIEKI